MEARYGDVSKVWGFYLEHVYSTSSLYMHAIVGGIMNRGEGGWQMVFHMSQFIHYADKRILNCVQVLDS